MGQRFAVAVALMITGCGSAPRAESPPGSSEAQLDAAVAVAPDAADAPTPTEQIACRVRGAICTEYHDVPGDRAAEIKQQCSASGADLLPACPKENVAATCSAPKPPMTVVSMVYKVKEKERTRRLVASSKIGCESSGGTFTSSVK